VDQENLTITGIEGLKTKKVGNITLVAKPMQMKFEDGHMETKDVYVPVREKNKVYIVGCASTKDMVPWDDPDAEYWGVNNLYGVPIEGAHYDRWFEIHNIWLDQGSNKMVRRELFDFRGTPIMDYMQGLANLKIPVYMQRWWGDLVPNSVPYPLQDIINYFANEKGFGLQIARYLTNSITHQIVLAIYEGFKEIQVWGVDMAVGSEYHVQKPSCEFWLGVAAGMGIKVVLPQEADLLKTRFIYGFEEPLQTAWHKKIKKVRVDMIRKQNEVAAQLEQNKKAFEQYVGAIHATNELEKLWENLDEMAKAGR
jgi:hypothetical protein